MPATLSEPNPAQANQPGSPGFFLSTKSGAESAKLSFLNFARSAFLMHRIFSACLIKGAGLSFCFRPAAHRLLTLLGLVVTLHATAAPDIPTQFVISSDFPLAREALVEVIEAEGLVVSAVIPFGAMLKRTGSALGKKGSPYAQLEIVQFCSARIAWLLVEEDVSQTALCPLSINIFSTVAEPDKVVFGYRSPGNLTPARLEATELLLKIVSRAVEVARFQQRH
jgi:uncharacterized protein (DUF302 family)